MQYYFEWDFTKARTNKAKHHVSFEQAASVFRDERALSIADDEHSQHEERWVTIGMDEVTRVLVVIHTYMRVEKDRCHVRIISARKATNDEQKIYVQG